MDTHSLCPSNFDHWRSPTALDRWTGTSQNPSIISIILIILIIIVIHDIHSNCDHLSQNYLSLKKLLSLVLIVEVLVTLGGRAGLASTLVGIILLFICLKSPIFVSLVPLVFLRGSVAV